MNGTFVRLFAIANRLVARIGNSVSAEELILSLVFLLAACGPRRETNDSHNSPVDRWQMVQGQGFLMSVPDSLSLHETQAVDFRLYSLEGRASMVVLSMYVGDFPSPEKLNQSVIDALNEKPSLADSTIRWQSGAALLGRETLIRLGSGTHHPRFLHVWYDSLSPRAAALDDSIIKTIVANGTTNAY